MSLNNGSDSPENKVPAILNPFRDTAMQYRDKWFKGTLILPYKLKESPPSNFTGKRAPYPTLEQINAWINDGQKHNICIRLAGVDDKYEILGIDVDDYMKGDKKKDGGCQLATLEKNLGALPETWIATARLDGVSGIRFFRVPRGLVFRGKADKDIEILQKRHRYALVWPSLHPEGGIYWWYPPGVKPDRDGKKAWNGELPDARSFPLLPDSWVDYLSNNRLIMPEDGLIDMDSTVDEIYDWATDTFYKDDSLVIEEDGTGGPEDTPMCDKMREKLNKHLVKIQNSSTFHDLLINAHWNLMMLAFEGHLGWNRAVNEMERVWCDAVAQRGGTTLRDVGTMRGEIFRSRIQALRQIKGRVDERKRIGAAAIDPLCIKTGVCGTKNTSYGSISGNDSNGAIVSFPVGGKDHTGSLTIDAGGNGPGGPPGSGGGQNGGVGGGGGPRKPTDDIPNGPLDPIGEYSQNDDGNASLLYDLFCHVVTGPSMRYIRNYGWIVWHEGIKDENGNYIKFPYWEVDRDGNQIMRLMWQDAKEKQEQYVNQLATDYEAELLQAINGGQPTSGVNAPAQLKRALKALERWSKWVERSGNNRQSDEAIKAARTLPYVRLEVDDLDSNPFLLGVANGVLELGDQVILREARLNDFITLNTNVMYTETPSEHSKNLWKDYLDTFLPDPELQKAVQVAFGYCLMGGNPEKKIIILKGDTNTGKSTFINAVKAALGDYAKSVNQSVFQNHKLNPVLGNALTKRLIVCSEFDEKDQLSASQVKRLTGSSDGLEVEMKNQNETLEAEAQFVAAIATNEVPGISGADKALANRLFVIPFDITPSTIIKGQDNAIIASAKTAILKWLVDGYVEYRRLGYIPVTTEMEESKRHFVSELDEVAAFAENHVKEATSPQLYISRKAMYDKFQQWWIEDNQQMNKIPSMTKFTRRLRALGYKTRDAKFRVNGELNYWWIGYKFEKKRSNVISMPTFVPDGSGTDDESGTDKNLS